MVNHKRFTDDWVDIHFNKIEADNEEQDRIRIEVMYPSVQGFVLDEFLGIVLEEFLEIGGSIE